MRTKLFDGNRKIGNVYVLKDEESISFSIKEKLIMTIWLKDLLSSIETAKYAELLETIIDSPFSRYVVRDTNGKPAFIFEIEIKLELKIIAVEGELRSKNRKAASFTTIDCPLSTPVAEIPERFISVNSALFDTYTAKLIQPSVELEYLKRGN